MAGFQGNQAQIPALAVQHKEPDNSTLTNERLLLSHHLQAEQALLRLDVSCVTTARLRVLLLLALEGRCDTEAHHPSLFWMLAIHL
ncbi:hypothetical protein ACTFJJ_24240, partial [Enterobacter roggenkampii]|uniref:hypothetical protein n=1 Tax=Enterobacter roggenkampii TaxID=1812935 RepID=UPI003F76C07A